MTTRGDVEAFNRAFAEALAQQDVDRVVGMYTDDAMLLFHGLPIVSGRSQIDAFLQKDLGEGPA